MTHRLGDGTKIETADLPAAMAEWQAKGYSKCTYCSKREWDAWQDDLGDLIATKPDGTELRRHANIKASTYRSGNPKIACNRVLIGNPIEYAKWLATPEPRSGTHIQWTYYPDTEFESLLAQFNA